MNLDIYWIDRTVSIDQLILLSYERDRKQNRPLTGEDKKIESRSWMALNKSREIQQKPSKLQEFRAWRAAQ